MVSNNPCISKTKTDSDFWPNYTNDTIRENDQTLDR